MPGLGVIMPNPTRSKTVPAGSFGFRNSRPSLPKNRGRCPILEEKCTGMKTHFGQFSFRFPHSALCSLVPDWFSHFFLWRRPHIFRRHSDIRGLPFIFVVVPIPDLKNIKNGAMYPVPRCSELVKAWPVPGSIGIRAASEMSAGARHPRRRFDCCWSVSDEGKNP
jgi:hypothetical protein